MNNNFLIRYLVAVVVLGILIISVVGFQVQQNEQVVITRFGQPVRTIIQPGLYAKWPWPIETVNTFDTRLNYTEIRISEALTRDKRNVLIPVFVAWKIADSVKFMESMGSQENAENKLDSLVGSNKNTILGQYDFAQLVSVNPSDVRISEIEEKILQASARPAASSFGIEIVQVGIQRLSLPEVNTRYVFDRMRAERSQFAARFRAEGNQQAHEITSRTDAEQAKILAQANKTAEETRGKAEAEAARIYATATSSNPDFYKFLRELDALKRVVNSNTTLVLDTNTPPFNLLKAGSHSGGDNPAKTEKP